MPRDIFCSYKVFREIFLIFIDLSTNSTVVDAAIKATRRLALGFPQHKFPPRVAEFLTWQSPKLMGSFYEKFCIILYILVFNKLLIVIRAPIDKMLFFRLVFELISVKFDISIKSVIFLR